MQSIISKVHAHMPYHLLPEYLEMILRNKLNLEIYFHHWALQNMDSRVVGKQRRFWPMLV